VWILVVEGTEGILVVGIELVVEVAVGIAVGIAVESQD
jgi:hypothetical protein